MHSPLQPSLAIITERDGGANTCLAWPYLLRSLREPLTEAPRFTGRKI